MSVEAWVFPGAILQPGTYNDGDTFTAMVTRALPFGFHVTITGAAPIKFRLNGCNAAPLSTKTKPSPSGDGAASRLAELLTAGPFTVESVGPYKYGDEWMAEVTLADGRNLTDVMVAEQWAAVWDGNGPQPLPPWPRTVAP